MKLNQDEQLKAEALARDIDSQLSLTEQCRPYAAQQYRPQARSFSVLHLDDVSGIPFLKDILGVDLYQLRSRVRASTGDLFVATCPAIHDYERYNQERLQLGRPEFVHAPAVGLAVEVSAACRERQVMSSLVETARQKGGMVFHPYMGIEAVWDLAAQVAELADVPTAVLAPPPPVTWYANDKCQMTRLVSNMLGAEWVVDGIIAANAGELARGLGQLAQKHSKVALKMARCASAMGNRVFDSSQLPTSEQELTQLTRAFLADKEWVEGEEVQAVAWEHSSASPSTQLWIPPAGEGKIRLDGVFEQLLEGQEQVFLGSVPSGLSEELNQSMAHVSLMIGAVYQALGYVGRCSFDFIVTGSGLRFTECNGRWGGTSTPMHLMDRLFPTGRPAYRARDFVADNLVGKPFQVLADALGDRLYDARTGHGNFILYNMGCLKDYGKFDVISVGSDVDEASRILEEELPLLVEAV